MRDAFFVFGVLVLILFVIAIVARELFPPKESQPAVIPSVLVCSDTRGDGRVVGVSAKINYYDGLYWIRDADGLWQSYNKSTWEWCATLSVDAARKKGILK